MSTIEYGTRNLLIGMRARKVHSCDNEMIDAMSEESAKVLVDICYTKLRQAHQMFLGVFNL